MKAQARSSDLIEELGQVGFIFSDKTGTLTCNEMEFVNCYIGTVDKVFGPKNATALKQARADRRMALGLAGDVSVVEMVKDDKGCYEFFEAMALCHDVNTKRGDDGGLTFQGQSPDEVALVMGVFQIGVKFLKQKIIGADTFYELEHPNGHKVQWQLMQTLEFSSDRKRMSTVMKNSETGEVEQKIDQNRKFGTKIA